MTKVINIFWLSVMLLAVYTGITAKENVAWYSQPGFEWSEIDKNFEYTLIAKEYAEEILPGVTSTVDIKAGNLDTETCNCGAWYDSSTKDDVDSHRIVIDEKGFVTDFGEDKWEGTFYSSGQVRSGVYTWSNGDVFTGTFGDGTSDKTGTIVFANGVTENLNDLNLNDISGKEYEIDPWVYYTIAHELAHHLEFLENRWDNSDPHDSKFKHFVQELVPRDLWYIEENYEYGDGEDRFFSDINY